MNIKQFLKVGALALSSLTIIVLVVFAISQSESKAKSPFSVASLKDVSAVELPAATAHLISQAPLDNRVDIAKEAIRMAANLVRPGVLPYVISTVSKVAPEIAPVVLEEAVKSKPEEIIPLTKAAIAAAPEKTKDLVKVAVSSRPEFFHSIGCVAAIEAPSKSDSILSAVKESLPQYENIFERASKYTDNNIVAALEYAQNVINQQIKEEAKKVQSQEIIKAIDNNQMVSTPADIIQKTSNLNKEAKKAIASAEKSVTSTFSAENTGIRYSMGPPRIVPVPYTPPLYNIKPQDTVVVQPGQARNYSTP